MGGVMIKRILFFLFMVIFCGTVITSHAEIKEPIRFDFENGMEGWDIPDWAAEQKDCVGREVKVSDKVASTGHNSFEILGDFPGNLWTSVVVEYEQDMNLKGYKKISVDVFVPQGAGGAANSELFLARIILTVGSWWFVEMRKPITITRGKWNTITAQLEGLGDEELVFWKVREKEQSVSANIQDVKKIGVRVEYNSNPWQEGKAYNGPVYIDNVVISE
ncbi:secreted protein [Candidatus Omnitrophus magneticus]|uniref:Secreted protein n=1 Tax=Candidatus Omnitrophus magneticus TaxID=1609969 RepID=A0A0F0CW11_9BACT|nr:secreted protein [Candidatus Omnitrophus magneticus]